MSHHRISSRRERGFTLTEILVAVAIFSLIMTAALLMYDRSNRVFKENVELANLQQNTRVAFDKLVTELRMAGYDFDRDGFPGASAANRFQQPDEQLEFIHRRAITFRANLDYETAAADDNGRETAYEPVGGQFSVVTTGNDEIVTYALVSDTASANDDSITFFADVARPRATFPGGADETLVTIDGVDLCQDASGANTGCLNPPYTLVRIALNNSITATNPAPIKVPVATDIRDLDLQYFSDATKTAAVTPNGGVGQAVASGANSAAAVTARNTRAIVRAIELSIVGMTEFPDRNWNDPREAALDTAEQVAEALKHRQYRLSSTIIPRNLGRRGLQELDTLPPGAPTITNVCWGACGVVLVEWDPPSTGLVDFYDIVWDTSATGSFTSRQDAGLSTAFFIDELDPNQTYYFKVVARNNFGSEFSNVDGPVQPRNSTRPEAPSNLVASGNSTAAPPAVPDQIDLTWSTPAANVGAPTYSGGCTRGDPAVISTPFEVDGYEIYRSDTSPFTPDTSYPNSTNRIWKGTRLDPDGPVIPNTLAGDPATFSDKTAKVNCRTYYYQIRGYEACGDPANPTPALNASNDVNEAISGFAVAADYGTSSASANPSVPQNAAANPASTCSTDPCSIVIEWDEVTSDVGGKPIWIEDYEVTRTTYNFGILDSTSEVPFDVVDSSPGDGARVSFVDDATSSVPPDGGGSLPAGRVYHYTVRAKQCGSFVGDPSTPDVQFPCASVSVSAAAPIDGTGDEASPWILENTADLSAISDTDLVSVSASAYDYPARLTSFPVSGAIDAVDPRLANFSFPLPGGDGLYEVEMVFTDANGCSLTVKKYVQESPNSCCLLPYKDDSGTIFDPTVLVVTSSGSGPGNGTIDLTFNNQCSSDLTIESLRLQWTGAGGTGSSNNLSAISYPGGIVDNFGGTIDSDGAHTFLPGSVGASTTIPGDGSYKVTLTFTRNASTTTATITNFCVVYTNGVVTGQQCSIAQESDSVCPLP
jgi:prepilin-type N-terminal cleavage/methylation domain-containing protein